MPVTPNTSTYKSGFNGSVTLGNTLWAQAKNIMLPKTTGGFVEELAMNGPQVFAEGITSFGECSFEIPQDGTANLISATEVTLTIAGGPVTSLSGACHVIGDDGGTMTRGSSAIRTISVKMHALLTGS